MKLTDEQLATVLAALRLYQRELANDAEPPRSVRDIATDNGRLNPLDIDEIDELCEDLNCEAEIS